MLRSLIADAVASLDYTSSDFLCEFALAKEEADPLDGLFARVKFGETLLQRGLNKRANLCLKAIPWEQWEDTLRAADVTTLFPDGQHVYIQELCDWARYLLGKSFFLLSQYHDAEVTLVRTNSRAMQLGKDQRARVPAGANGLHLMGEVCLATNRRDMAIGLFRDALVSNNYHWASYAKLCELGADIDAGECFQGDIPTLYKQYAQAQAPAMHMATRRNPQDMGPPSTVTKKVDFGSDTPASGNNRAELSGIGEMSGIGGMNSVKSAKTSSNSQSVEKTPFIGSPFELPQDNHRGGYASDESSKKEGQKKLQFLDDSTSPSMNNFAEEHDDDLIGGVLSFGSESDVKWSCNRCTFLNNKEVAVCEICGDQKPSTVEDDLMGSSIKDLTGSYARSPALNESSLFLFKAAPDSVETKAAESIQSTTRKRKSPFSSVKRTESEPASDQDRISLQIYAHAYRLACLYQCRQALEALNLPRDILAGSVVRRLQATCYFELNDYGRSTTLFASARKQTPFVLSGMDIYSTALWHLKKEVKLSFLAQELTATDRTAAETWIVVGNCFSLQKEHDTAVRFFTRAQQVNPKHAYAQTLSAHEHAANEDFDKAVAGYRRAVALDDRHYNAWYGLASIYKRQEKHDMARYHMERALAVNSQSSVLCCYLGMVLSTLEDYEGALEWLQRSDSLEPNNPLAKFQTANVYVAMGEHKLALQELEQVLLLAPREAAVHFLMGKIYVKLRQPDAALMRYMTALDLDPKDRAVIKAAIDKLQAAVEDDEREEDDESDFSDLMDE